MARDEIIKVVEPDQFPLGCEFVKLQAVITKALKKFLWIAASFAQAFGPKLGK